MTVILKVYCDKDKIREYEAKGVIKLNNGSFMHEISLPSKEDSITKILLIHASDCEISKHLKPSYNGILNEILEHYCREGMGQHDHVNPYIGPIYIRFHDKKTGIAEWIENNNFQSGYEIAKIPVFCFPDCLHKINEHFQKSKDSSLEAILSSLMPPVTSHMLSLSLLCQCYMTVVAQNENAVKSTVFAKAFHLMDWQPVSSPILSNIDLQKISEKIKVFISKHVDNIKNECKNSKIPEENSRKFLDFLNNINENTDQEVSDMEISSVFCFIEEMRLKSNNLW